MIYVVPGIIPSTTRVLGLGHVVGTAGVMCIGHRAPAATADRVCVPQYRAAYFCTTRKQHSFVSGSGTMHVNT